METAFTPVASFGGGLLIGLSALLLMLMLGRIMGATGILSGVVVPVSGDFGWRAAVLAGMIAGPIVLTWVSGTAPVIDVPVSMPALVIGGVLVGMGVTFGGGCTSGHGVCGNARFSARSIVATLTFMAAAIMTVFILRHGIGG